MDSILKFLVFVFAVCVLQSKETIGDLISVKLNENLVYDCVDIYKQPSLSHPLLQNHKIQLKPSFSIFKPKNQIRNKSERKKIINCPNGTVPILKNTKEYVANTQYWTEKHFNPLTVESHGTHIAGVRSQGQGPYHGVEAWMSIHGLNVSGDQASYVHIYVGSRVNNKFNFIQTGWMVNPSVFGDGRTWSYGFWKGANGAGCYNTVCPGFIQVSKTDPLTGPLGIDPKGKKGLYISIVQDKKSENWWVKDANVIAEDINIGYWPQELFDLIGNSVEIVGAGGAVQASPSGKSPPMGNGHFPSQDDYASARVTHIEIVDSKFKVKESDKYKLEKLLDSNKCYGLQNGKKVGFFKESVLFTFGGPGGDACGI